MPNHAKQKRKEERLERRKRIGTLAICIPLGLCAATTLVVTIVELLSGTWKMRYNLILPDQPVGPFFRLIGSVGILAGVVIAWRSLRQKGGPGI